MTENEVRAALKWLDNHREYLSINAIAKAAAVPPVSLRNFLNGKNKTLSGRHRIAVAQWFKDNIKNSLPCK